MRYILIIFFIILSCSKSFADFELKALYANTFFNPEIIQIENFFISQLADYGSRIVYTRVPRGLIISVAEDVFFNKGKVELKPESYKILDIIAAVLKNFDNKCVIESHTDEAVSDDDLYKADWELSLRRANRVADYLVKYGKISKNRIFPVGFGEMMPFKENVSRSGFMDSRVDFVILDYELKR